MSTSDPSFGLKVSLIYDRKPSILLSFHCESLFLDKLSILTALKRICERRELYIFRTLEELGRKTQALLDFRRDFARLLKAAILIETFEQALVFKRTT